MDPKVYTAIGLMSGTSLDGVDAAIIRTDGERIFELLGTEYCDYNADELDELSGATSRALDWNFSGPVPNAFGRAGEILDNAHARVLGQVFGNASTFDVIGYHGQTLVHRPPSQGSAGQTLQIGNGQTLANRFDTPCVYDFRSADMTAGGQGAPLAPIYHKALCEYSGLTGNTVVLNLGGVGNFTWAGEGALLASDTGPANGPLDSWLNQHGQDYDPDGKHSAEGTIDFELVEKWLSAGFFKKPIPKSADRYDFDVIGDLGGMSLVDGAATLAAFCALSVKSTLAHLTGVIDQIIVCGGGRRNKTIMNMLRAEMDCPVRSAEDVGWRGDFIEAEAFAYLAVRALKGLPISFPGTTGVSKPMTGGRVAYPANKR